jgi:hypothetical protein
MSLGEFTYSDEYDSQINTMDDNDSSVYGTYLKDYPMLA